MQKYYPYVFPSTILNLLFKLLKKFLNKVFKIISIKFSLSSTRVQVISSITINYWVKPR